MLSLLTTHHVLQISKPPIYLGHGCSRPAANACAQLQRGTILEQRTNKAPVPDERGLQINLISQVVVVTTKVTAKNTGKAAVDSVEFCHLETHLRNAAAIEVPLFPLNSSHQLLPSPPPLLQSMENIAMRSIALPWPKLPCLFSGQTDKGKVMNEKARQSTDTSIS